MACKYCGTRTNDGETCQPCRMWETYVKDNRSRRQVRVGGKLYVIRTETGKTRLDVDAKLYQHYIQFRNGSRLYTTNMSLVGDIPQYFRKSLPDNAIFVSSWDKEKYA